MQRYAFYKKSELHAPVASLNAEYWRSCLPQACCSVDERSSNWLICIMAAALICLTLFGVSLAFPQTAQAKSYDMPKVTINAEVLPDGDLVVTEQREFDLDGSFTAVWWSYDDFPAGASLSIDSLRMAHVDSSGEVQDDWASLSKVPFQLEWRTKGGPGKSAYSFDEPENTVYAFFDESDTRIVFELSYTVEDAVQAYSDVAELYWQFVGSQWEEASSNVYLKVTLPVASGSTVQPGENVYAWGHGPLDATVSISGDGTVIYTVPRVDPGSYAEARIVFPTEWLTAVSSGDDNAYFSTARLDEVLSEERTWADQANAQRAASLGLILVVVVGCAALLLWALRSFFRYGKELNPRFTDQYWRDVPVKGEHPAVIGRLWRFNKQDACDFTATIMHLANEGAILINKGSYQVDGFFGAKTEEDYYLTRVPDVELRLNSEIDRRAMKILFDKIAKGEPSLWLGSIKAYAEEEPQRFSDSMDSWQGVVSAHVNAGEYFESYSQVKRTRMASVAAIAIAVCVLLAFVFSNIVVVVPGIITGAVMIVVSRFMERRTQNGADAYARCKALKKWLTEFSSLDERPPLDVKVWGEYMVYALLFGVADRAMAELEKAQPEVRANDLSSMNSYGPMPWWIWYSSTNSASSLPDAGTSLQNVITASIAESVSALSGSSSSGGGFGGGFSGGGGGGFGGGGGGAR